MKKLAAILIALACSAQAQTFITVTADTNRVIRTNFSLVRSQVSDLSGATFAISNITSLQTSLDGKLATNGSAFALTNFPASVLLTNGNAAGLTNFPASVLLTNGNAVGLTNFPASLLQTNGNASALTNFPALALSNVTGTLSIANGGTGQTNAAFAIEAFLPAYTNNADKVLALNSNATGLIWVTNGGGGGGGLTSPVAVVDGGTGATNAPDARVNLLPAYTNNEQKVLAVTTNGADVEWVSVSNTVTDASTLTNFPPANLTNVTNVLAIVSGGTGATNAAAAIEALLPAYTNNESKFLALNTNATALEWVTNSGGGGLTSPVAIVDGGTGATNSLAAATALLYGNFTNTNGVTGNIFIGTNNALNADINSSAIAIGATNTVANAGVSIGINITNSANNGVAIGKNAYNTQSGGVAVGEFAWNWGAVAIGEGAWATNNGSIAIGNGALASEDGVAIGGGARATNTGDTEGGVAIGDDARASSGGVAIGFGSRAFGDGAAVGDRAQAYNGFAGGLFAYALASNNVQLGDGYNDTDETIQFRNAGLVDTNEWAALANAGTVGTNLLRATNITNAQAAIFTATTTNAPTNTNAPTPNAWLDIRVGTNDYKLPLWQ